jgi:hypothetical protein
MVGSVERIVVVHRRLAGHIVGEGVLRSQLLEADHIAEVVELHSQELEIVRHMAVVAEGMVADRIVLEEVGRMEAAEGDMAADHIVLEVGHRKLAAEEDIVVEDIVLEAVGHMLAVVEEGTVHKGVAGNLFVVSVCHFSSISCTHDPAGEARRKEDIRLDKPCLVFLLYQLSLESARAGEGKRRLIEQQSGGSKGSLYVGRRRRT